MKKAILLKNDQPVTPERNVTAIETACTILEQLYPTSRWSVQRVTPETEPVGPVFDSIHKNPFGEILANGVHIAIVFKSAPDQLTTENLKSLGFTWYGKVKQWRISMNQEKPIDKRFLITILDQAKAREIK